MLGMTHSHLGGEKHWCQDKGWCMPCSACRQYQPALARPEEYNMWLATEALPPKCRSKFVTTFI